MLCYVKDCKCPIDEHKQLRKKLRLATGEEKYVCEICWEMFTAINRNMWFVEAQQEYIDYLKKISRLKSGGDYFSE